MSSPFTARQAGIASIAAAGLILLSQVLQLVLPMTVPESFWNATQTLRMGLALLAMFALLLALTGLHARQASVAGRLGLVGYVAASLGTLLVAGDWWYEAFIGPVLLVQAPELLATAVSGSILIGAGLTFGIFAAPVVAGVLGFPPVAGETFGAGGVLDAHPAPPPPEHTGLAVGTFDVDGFRVLEESGARGNW